MNDSMHRRDMRQKLTWKRTASVLSRYAFPLPALIYLVALMVYPVLYTVYLSLRDVNVGNFLSGDASFVGLDNHGDVISAPEFPRVMAITVTFTVGSLVFQHAIGFALAVFFNGRFRLSGLLRSLLLVGWILPTVVSASLWRWMYSGSFGVINAILDVVGIGDGNHGWLIDSNTALYAVIIANIWLGIPFHMLLLHAGLQDIPAELYEAASVDGVNGTQRFFYITFPLMRPVMLITLLLGFINTFKTFDVIYVMTVGGPAGATTVLSILVYELTFDFFDLGLGAAAANILLVIPLLLSAIYLWVRRREEIS